MRRAAPAYLVGLIFGVGLVVSGMTDPRNVVGFLDFGGLTGPWNAALIGVMGSALLTHALLLRLLARRAPWRSPSPSSAPSLLAGVDRSLVVGSAVFGVGWGLAGYCPGPAIVSLGFGPGRVWLFVAASIAGSLLADALRASRAGAGARPLHVSEADR